MTVEYEFAGLTWWATTRRYEDERRAKEAFDTVMEIGRQHGGRLLVGVYRHGPSWDGPRFLTVLGHYRKGFDYVERLLDGEESELEDAELLALTMRRIEVVKNLADENAPAGSYVNQAQDRGAAARRRDDGGAGLSDASRRAEQIRQNLVETGVISEQAPAIFYGVFCNRCGKIVTASSPREFEHAVYGWLISPEYGGDDYCPDCR